MSVQDMIHRDRVVIAPEAMCLIGHTGFVGSTLQRQAKFLHTFNRSNIGKLANAPRFEIAVCAAAPGSMLQANSHPDEDLALIRGLMDDLSKLRTQKLILISSIAVLSDFAAGYDESTACFQTSLPYGMHRRALELFCADRFDTHIVRLPALFGRGLRKNFVFDLVNPIPSLLSQERFQQIERKTGLLLSSELRTFYTHDKTTGLLRLDRELLNCSISRKGLEAALTDAELSATWFHNPESSFQYYDVSQLWDDIMQLVSAGIQEIHFASEPLLAAHIYKRLFGANMPKTGARIHREDMRTLHADLWNRNGPYIFSADDVLDRLERFYLEERSVL